MIDPRRSLNALALDLGNAAGADEHPPTPDRDDEPVDVRRPRAEVKDDVDQATDIGAVGPHQRQPRQRVT